MTSLAEIEEQIKKLQAEAEKIKNEQVSAAIDQIKELMSKHGITVEDLQSFTKKARKKSPLKVKYRDPISGKEWTGRGRSPKWLEGKNKDDFAV